jgi:DNA polymerase-3 subunit gamma/tau
MAVIRLTHVADLPSPDELVRKLQGQTPPPPPPSGGHAPGHASGGAQAVANRSRAMASQPTGSGSVQALAHDPAEALARFPTFAHVVDLIRANRDVKLLVEVETCLRLAAYQPGRIEFTPTPDAAPDLAQRLGARLQTWTGNRWAVTVVNTADAPTIAETRDAADLATRAEAEQHPLVQAVLAQFPKAKITAIRSPEDLATEAEVEALEEVEDEWDPFEED